MKRFIYISGIILICFFGCKTTKPVSEIKPQINPSRVSVTEETPRAVNFSDQSTWLLGYFKAERLAMEPHSSWYTEGFEEYQINSDAVNKLLDIKTDNLKIIIVMGTWCPDSRREVPKFMRLLDIWRFPLSQVTFIGVDKAKISSVNDYESLNIQRVPTFIIYKNNIEAGRIIENPETSLEQDMINILTRNE